MNVWMLGNGFDLFYSLPTRYIDFLQITDHLAGLENIEQMSSVGDLLNSFIISNQDNNIVKSCYEKYKSTYDLLSVPQKTLSEMRETAATNLWYRYFSSFLTNNIGWIDFEKKYHMLLKNLKKLLMIVFLLL